MLRIAIANTPAQIDEVLRLRHQVLAKGPAAPSDKPKRLMDYFDAFPTTTHLIAILNNRVIASLRLTFDSSAQTPADEYYDFRSVLETNSKVLSCDLHCVHPEFYSPQITASMLLMASYLAIAENVTHLIAPVNTDAVKALEEIGFKSLLPCQKRKRVPMVLDIQTDLKDHFVQFSRKNELQGIMHSYGCALYEPGETILRAGTVGNCAFVITGGEVSVKHAGSDEVVDTMGAGEVFGEMTLLTDQVRSADIIAKTSVRTMVLEKSVFVDHLMSEPKVALKLLQSMGHRMNHLIDYCHTLTA
ncbi:MAG: cyclic nucleotide-binding domain-containing protein [Cyanobacteria bacterium J06560_2]